MELTALKEQDAQYIAGTYGRMDLVIEEGQGAQCRGSGGELVDFSSGIGVNALGYSNPGWVQAVKNQLDTLSHASNLYYTAPQTALAKALCRRTGMKKVFFGNSGAEANECAIKCARKYGMDHYGADHNEIVTLTNSFHGRTIATLAATGQDAFHKNFGPFPAGFRYAAAGDVGDLRSKISDNTCAILVECIQGEGGVVPLTAEFLAAVSQICRERDILLITDEIQTGVGRTGRFLCGEYFDLKPDIVTLAKGLGGGLPIGACLMGEKTSDTLGKGDHGSTFGGNPVVCAGALEVLRAMDDAFLAEVARKGAHLVERMSAMEGVTGITGRGMMLGVSLCEGLVAADIVAACIQRGLILLTAKEKIRLLPPLNIPDSDIETGLAVLEAVLKEKSAALSASHGGKQ